MEVYPNLPSSLVLYIDIFHQNDENPLPIYSQLSNFVGRFKILKPLDTLSPNPNHNLSTTSPQGIPSDPPVVLTPDLPVIHHSKDQYCLAVSSRSPKTFNSPALCRVVSAFEPDFIRWAPCYCFRLPLRKGLAHHNKRRFPFFMVLAQNYLASTNTAGEFVIRNILSLHRTVLAVSQWF